LNGAVKWKNYLSNYTGSDVCRPTPQKQNHRMKLEQWVSDFEESPHSLQFLK
jgi:hypothetical protein